MSKPTSNVAVCNLALDLLNEKTISDIDSPSSPIEQLCARWYDMTRRELLETSNFAFSQTSEAIPRGGTPTINRYADYYVFPNNYLKLTALVDWDYPLQRFDYRIEGKRLLINRGGAASIDTWFIQDIEDVTLFPGYFTELLAGTLAVSIGPKITAKPSALKFASEYVAEARRKASGANGQIQPPRRFQRSKIVNAGRHPSMNNEVAGPYNFLFEAN